MVEFHRPAGSKSRPPTVRRLNGQGSGRSRLPNRPFLFLIEYQQSGISRPQIERDLLRAGLHPVAFTSLRIPDPGLTAGSHFLAERKLERMGLVQVRISEQ